MTTIVAEHSSGRFDVEPATLKAALVKQLADRPDFLSLTEMMSEARAEVLWDFTSPYAFTRVKGPDGQDECVLMTNGDRWRVGTAHALKLSERGIPRRSGSFCFALVVEVESLASGDRHTRIVIHLPSGVEDDLREDRSGPQVDVYRDAIRGLQELVASIDGPVVITGDWNIDLRRPWVRSYLSHHFPRFARTWWSGNFPERGTRGERVIDFSLVRGFTVVGAQVVSSFGASDHRAIHEEHEVKETAVSTKAETYPRADHTTQWFADNYVGDRFDANCGVLHSTEGTDWPGYDGGAKAPNVTAKPDFANKRLVWRQHFPIDMSSRALRNESGGVETNTLNVSQVELVGTCDPKHKTSWNGQGKLLAGKHYIFWPDAPEWALADLAAFMRWCYTEHGIPLTGPKTWLPYPKSYGSAAGNRLTFDQWTSFTGWCGHQHVPENVHGDPGDLDFARVLELAKPQPTPAPAPVVHSTPRWDLIWETANEIAKDKPAGTASGDAAREVRTIAAKRSTKH